MDCSFTNTCTISTGGGVYINNGGNVDGCSFTNTRSSGTGGGGVYIDTFGGSVMNCNFTKTINTFESGGGGVFFAGSGNVTGCNFIGCSSNNGNAISLANGYTSNS